MAEQPTSVPDANTAERLTQVETKLSRLDAEVRTNRLVVADHMGRDRLTAEVVGPHVELRLIVPDSPPGHRSSVLLYASEPSPEGGTSLGVELWGEGNALAGMDAHQQSPGQWLIGIDVDDHADRSTGLSADPA